jgi:hypothetical protein
MPFAKASVAKDGSLRKTRSQQVGHPMDVDSQRGKPMPEISKSSGRKFSIDGVMAAFAATIVTASIGYAFGVANEYRKDQLDFVNAQIERLYGPVYAATLASGESWAEFGTPKYWRSEPSNGFFDDVNPPTVEEAKRWRRWMANVFQPLNIRAEDAIINNAQLILGDTMPTTFKLFIAHTEGYKAIVSSWREDDFENCDKPDVKSCPQLASIQNTAPRGFPKNFVDCVQIDYNSLKNRQRELSGSLFGSLFVKRLERSPVCDQNGLR